jgi:hypothetical protein
MDQIGERAARRFPPPWSVEDNGACFISGAAQLGASGGVPLDGAVT